MERLALKRLTKSDLTFLKDFFDGPADKKIKQKALNLNSDVFVDVFYPELKTASSDKTIYVDLNVFGPGGADRLSLARKIRKGDAYKNWRLNGEFIHTPDDTPHRFDSLHEEDIAIIGFIGTPEPTHVYLDFIAASNELDAPLYFQIDGLIPRVSSHNRSTMAPISARQLQSILETTGVIDSHPIYRFILDEDLVEAVQGDSDAQLRVFRRSGRSMTKEELSEAKQHADHTGDFGEELVNVYLQKQKEAGVITDFCWVSKRNAIAPYDFTITNCDGSIQRIDVKTTKGAFNTGFHISMAELLTMQESTPYRIYRVFTLNVADGSALLRISNEFKSYADSIVDTLSKIPYHVRPDALTCQADYFEFQEKIIKLTQD